MSRPACRSCGATMTADARWCPRCYRRVLPDDGIDALLADLSKIDGPDRWTPPKRLTEARTVRSVTSRVRPGPTTYGIGGRLAWTMGVGLLTALGAGMMMQTILGRLGMVLYVAFVAPGVALLMASVWRRERFVEVVEPDRRCRVCGYGMNLESPSCPRCAASV